MIEARITLLTEDGGQAFVLQLREDGRPEFVTFAPGAVVVRRLSAEVRGLPDGLDLQELAGLREQVEKVQEIVCDHDYEEY